MIRAISSFLSKLGLVSKKMVSSETIKSINILDPPAKVRGMTKWQPELFEKSVILPHVTLPSVNFANQKAGNILRKYKLSIPNFTNIFNVDGDKEIKRVILDPKKFEEMTDEDKKLIFETYEGKVGQTEYVLKHTNYSPPEALKAVFPEGVEGLSASQQVGHICHVNLRDELLPYKEVIGHVMFNFSNRIELV